MFPGESREVAGAAEPPLGAARRLMKPIQRLIRSPGISLLQHAVGLKARGSGVEAWQPVLLSLGTFGRSDLGKSRDRGSLGDAPDTLPAPSVSRTRALGGLPAPCLWEGNNPKVSDPLNIRGSPTARLLPSTRACTRVEEPPGL